LKTLHPGRDRLTVDHEVVARNPEKFVACWERDVTVRSQLCDLIERSRRQRPTRPSRTSSGLGGSALEVATQSNNYGLGGSLNVRDPRWAL